MTQEEIQKIRNEYLQDAQTLKDRFIDEEIRKKDIFINEWNRIQQKLNNLKEEETKQDKLNK